MQSYRPPTYFKQGRYHTLDVLGTGTYGQVIRCRDEQSGKEVAIKVAQQNQAYRLSALNEIRALQALQNCQDAVKMLDCFEEGGHVCIVTELLYKNLYDILRAQSFEPLDVHDIRRVALHLLRALTALHQAGYMHCDVKPENIMLRFRPATADDAMAQQQPPYNASLLGEQYSYYALQEQAVNFHYKSHGHIQANQPLPGNFAPGAATSLCSSLSYHTSSGLIESPRDDNSTSTLLSDDEPLSLLNIYTHATMTAAQPVSESAAHGFLSNGNKKVIYTSSAAATGPSPQPHNMPGTSATAPAAVSFDATCLIDFGAVRKFSENNYFDVQSLWYRAPEVLCELPYTISIDAWSVGCVLFELYTGKALFPGQNTQDQFARIVQLRGYPSQAALRARLSGHTAHTTTALSPRLGARVATESQVWRWMWRCRRQAYRTVRAKARQGTTTATTTTTHTQEQIQVSLDELLNGQSKSDYAGPYNTALIAGDEQQQQNDEEEDEMMDEVESDLLGLILALLEPDESHRLSCSAALMHPFLTRTYNGNTMNSARLNFAPASYHHHQQQPPTFQDANANNALWTHTTGAATTSGPHTHTLAHPTAPHHHHLLPFHSNNTTNTSAGGVGLMYDETQKTALPLPMMGTIPHTTLQASPHHTTLLSTMPHYTVMSTGPGMGHGQPGTTHALTTSEPQPSCNNGVYNNNNSTSTTTATGATGAVPMMGNVGVMHSMNACLPSQSTNTTTATQGNPTMTATAPMYGLVMQPTVNNNNNNNNNSVTVGNNATMAYGTQGMLQYQALHNPHTNSNSSGNALNTPSTTTTTTSMLDMSSPLYNLSTNSFTTVSQDVNRQQQQQQQQQQQHVMQCMAVNEQRSQSDGRLNGQAEMNHGNGAATTVFMPMAMSPVMYYQPVPMTLQAMQPRLELPGNNNNNSSGANNASQQTHVTYSTVMAAPGSMQPIATQPSQASSLYPCYVSTEQTQNYSGQYTNSSGNNMATSAPVRQDFDERTMQGGLMLQMPPVTTTTLSNNNNNNNNQYSTQPHYSRVSGYSCIAQEGYGGRMDGMYYFNVSLPLTHQQTILLSSS